MRETPTAAGYNAVMAAAIELHPEIEPFDTGWLDVGDGHRLYFEQVGCREGLAAVYLHGGPGSGCSPRQRRFFDPRRYRAVLFDQRGSGRSTPRGETRHNTTEHLIADMERLRAHLDIERWLVVGGSWGASLAIAYAARHPNSVAGLVLRGVFLTGRRDLEWFFQESAAFAPDAWQRFAAIAPQRRRRNLLDYLAAQPGGRRSGPGIAGGDGVGALRAGIERRPGGADAAKRRQERRRRCASSTSTGCRPITSTVAAFSARPGCSTAPACCSAFPPLSCMGAWTWCAGRRTPGACTAPYMAAACPWSKAAVTIPSCRRWRAA